MKPPRKRPELMEIGDEVYALLRMAEQDWEISLFSRPRLGWDWREFVFTRNNALRRP